MFAILPAKNLGGPKTSNFLMSFAQLRNFIRNISGLRQDIVSRKMAWQSVDTHTCTLNLVNLSHKWQNIGP